MTDVVFGSHNASNTLQASARVHVMAIDNLLRELGVTVASMSADQRRVLVTGVLGGIGRATAAAFRADGWWVIGTDRADASTATRRPIS